ncbi:hypothetical protein AAL_03751 [Moelleriella libera RCEF 2490]|uniref:Uncharacterized protein n=1 Tax=Moelleriella libera RCEF 2490 TaxID=1081109 RepID=A0A162INJ0_9HYPO|nr:hypothetical protein AAL_03751 [Moelleriella libera RCEF 2490]
MPSSSPVLSLLKTLFIPAVISLIVFVVLTFAVVPVWRRYQNRYSQYLPLDTLSQRTSGLRHRILHRLSTLTPLSAWRRNRDAAENYATDTFLEDGEELGDIDQATLSAISRHILSTMHDSTRRLSRDLEEGFMDDSDEEEPRE